MRYMLHRQGDQLAVLADGSPASSDTIPAVPAHLAGPVGVNR